MAQINQACKMALVTLQYHSTGHLVYRYKEIDSLFCQYHQFLKLSLFTEGLLYKRPALHSKPVEVLERAFRTRKVFGNFKKRPPPPHKCFKIFTNFHLTMNLIVQKMQFYTTTSGLLSTSSGSIEIKNK
mgnify:CR=1 FL=1